MYHLCTTTIFPAIHHKRKILDIRLNIKDFPCNKIDLPSPKERPFEYIGRALGTLLLEIFEVYGLLFLE